MPQSCIGVDGQKSSLVNTLPITKKNKYTVVTEARKLWMYVGVVELLRNLPLYGDINTPVLATTTAKRPLRKVI